MSSSTVNVRLVSSRASLKVIFWSFCKLPNSRSLPGDIAITKVDGPVNWLTSSV